MKITIVLVLYKQRIEESKTYQSLQKTLFNHKCDSLSTELILFDNSPTKQEFVDQVQSDFSITYIHDERNLGISNAYNAALEKARTNGSEWLMLLDHDTELTADYMEQLSILGTMEDSVVAVVPKIVSEDIMISPVFSNTLKPLRTERPQPGIQDHAVMAINSGSLVRVNFLDEINGFSNEFPLDYLDHWLFFMIYAKGKKVWVVDTVLNHELSVMDYSRVSTDRYRSILTAETLFYKKYKKELFPAYRNQLILRLFKQLLLVKNKKIAMNTLRNLLSHLNGQ